MYLYSSSCTPVVAKVPWPQSSWSNLGSFQNSREPNFFIYIVVCSEISPAHNVACILVFSSVARASCYTIILLSRRHPCSSLPAHLQRPRKPVPKSGCLFWH